MRKFCTVLLTAVLAAVSALGCAPAPSNRSPILAEYDAADLAPQQTFTFDSDYDAQPAHKYPESTGRTFYVAAAGSDNSNGLNKSEPMSIRAASDLVLRPGDRILLKGGDAFINGRLTVKASGEDDNPIYIGVYDAHLGRPNIVFSGSNGAVTVQRASNVVVEGLEVTLNTTAAVGTSAGTYGILLDFRDYKPGDETRYRNLYVLDNVVRGGNNINVDTFGIRMLGSTDFPENDPQHYVENVYIENNTVHNVGINGIASSWENWGAGRTEHNGVSRDVYRNVHIDGNTVYNVGYIGIIEQSTCDSTIHRNVVYKTAQTTSGVDYSGNCGIMPISCERVDVAFNETYANECAHYRVDAMGIDIDWNCKNVTVRYNYCHDNFGSGIGTMACKDCTIANNKIVDSMGLVTYNYAFLSVGDFTNYANEHDEELRSVKNLKVENNILIANKPYAEGAAESLTFFGALSNNGRGEWEGNTYVGNHVVSRIADSSVKIIWNNVAPSRDWYKFADNRYYGPGGNAFTAYDETAQDQIDPSAVALDTGIAQTFDVWKTRDVGSVYQKTDYDEPAQVTGVAATFAEGKIELTWDDRDVWHYNVYLVGENQTQAYSNMLGEAFDNAFTFTPAYKGTYYIVIEPESNTGVLGRPVKIKTEVR